MGYAIHVDDFISIFPECRDPAEWVDAINYAMASNDMATPDRMAAFIAQCGHETAGWSVFVENLNYSANSMMRVWPSRFNKDLAQRCHRKPELVAEHAYGGRLGNGPPGSGDGWKYRGRGCIQITGKENYMRFAGYAFNDDDIMKEFMDNPDILVQDKSLCLGSALWYWQTRNLNRFVDAQDFKELTRRINGGYHGLASREHLYQDLLQVIV